MVSQRPWFFNNAALAGGLRSDAARAEGPRHFFLSLKVRTFVKVPPAPVHLTVRGLLVVSGGKVIHLTRARSSDTMVALD